MRLATTTGDFDKYCGTYLERVKQINKAGFKYIDLSLYTVRENDELLINEDWKTAVKELLAYANENGLKFVQCHSPNTNPLDEAQVERAFYIICITNHAVFDPLFCCIDVVS